MSEVKNLTYNTEIEHEVLGTCITNTEIYDEVKDRLSRDLFTDISSLRCYDIICSLVNEGKQPDITEVGMRLSAQGEEIGKFIPLTAGSIVITTQRVELLIEMRMRREIYNLCYKGLSIANDPMADIDSVNELIKNFQNIMTAEKDMEVQQFGEVQKGVLNDVAKRKEGKEDQGILTGLKVFDRTYGFHEGDLVIIAGYPSHGKTTLATTIAKNIAAYGVPSVFYSMEMTAKQLTARILASVTNVPATQILYGKLNDVEFDSFYDSAKKVANLPLYFDERNKTSISKIKNSVHRLVKLYGVRVVFVDYLQILVNGSRLDSREQILGDMARDLKRMAVEENVCVVALSQLNRKDKEANQEPRISSMRGSGQIEEACDEAVLVYRADLCGAKVYKSGQQTKGTAKIIIGKGRNVGTDSEIVKFNGELNYFADFEHGDPQAPYQEQTSPLPF